MNTLLRKTLPVANIHTGLLLLRVLAAAFMLTHGFPKLIQLFTGDPESFSSVLGMNPALSLLLAVFAEFLCSTLIILGFFTRLASIPLIITMAVAAFHVHSADPFATKEKALLFLLIFTFLLLTGGGNYSVDGIMYKKFRKRQRRYI
ncbi:MAG: DoxX family protein [Mariniphaga sp.]